MAVTRSDQDQVWDASGRLVSTKPVVRDVTRDVNEAAIRAKASSALSANATFLALASPTNAQTLAQVQLLTRECNAIIRLLLGRLEVDDA